jgi:hypothetical protein
MNRTHVEDVKDPDEVLIPSRDLVPIVLREDEPKEGIPFALLSDLPFDLCHGSAIETSSVGLEQPARL